jgi:uncharacterized protein with HEPN domain
MSRSLKLYCDDILISCDKILRYTQGLDDQSFFGDELRFDAVIRNLQVIGESVKQIPPEIRNKYPDIEWPKVSSLLHECLLLCYRLLSEVVSVAWRLAIVTTIFNAKLLIPPSIEAIVEP